MGNKNKGKVEEEKSEDSECQTSCKSSSSVRNGFKVLELPDEMICYICVFLPPLDTLNYFLVKKDIQVICERHGLYNQKIRAHENKLLSNEFDEELSPKDRFIRILEMLRRRNSVENYRRVNFEKTMESITREKWAVDIDWKKITTRYYGSSQKEPGEEDLNSLCRKIYEAHISSLKMGIEALLRYDNNEGIFLSSLLKKCSNRKVSFKFVEEQDSPFCKGRPIGIEVDKNGVLWITVNLNNEKQHEQKEYWIDIPRIDSNLILNVIGFDDTPPLFFRYHMASADEDLEQLKSTLNSLLDSSNWEVQIGWEDIRSKLEADLIRIRMFGRTISKYFSFFLKRVKDYFSSSDENMKKFEETFFKRIVALEYVGRNGGADDDDFRYCGIANYEDGICRIVVKVWRVNINEMGSRMNLIENVLEKS